MVVINYGSFALQLCDFASLMFFRVFVLFVKLFETVLREQ